MTERDIPILLDIGVQSILMAISTWLLIFTTLEIGTWAFYFMISILVNLNYQMRFSMLFHRDFVEHKNKKWLDNFTVFFKKITFLFSGIFFIVYILYFEFWMNTPILHKLGVFTLVVMCYVPMLIFYGILIWNYKTL